MKKLLMILLFAVLMLAAGCSSGSGDVDMSAEDAAVRLLEEVTFRDTLVKAPDDAASNYYKFDDTITEFSVYLSGSGATAEEITVLKVAEGGDAEKARSILEKRVESQKIRYADYVPGELVKLESPVIVSQGNMIIMILADDATQAEKAVNTLLKGEK